MFLYSGLGIYGDALLFVLRCGSRLLECFALLWLLDWLWLLGFNYFTRSDIFKHFEFELL